MPAELGRAVDVVMWLDRPANHRRELLEDLLDGWLPTQTGCRFHLDRTWADPRERKPNLPDRPVDSDRDGCRRPVRARGRDVRA